MGSEMGSAALRQRAYRARQRDDMAVLDVSVSFNKFVSSLLCSGRLSEREALDRTKVELAAAKILADFTDRWDQE